jgi:hypothetical protein
MAMKANLSLPRHESSPLFALISDSESATVSLSVPELTAEELEAKRLSDLEQEARKKGAKMIAKLVRADLFVQIGLLVFVLGSPNKSEHHSLCLGPLSRLACRLWCGALPFAPGSRG